MIDSYERLAFLAMVDGDERAVAAGLWPKFGRAGWKRFLAHRRFAVRRLPITCHGGYTCPGPFMEMHEHYPAGSDRTEGGRS